MNKQDALNWLVANVNQWPKTIWEVWTQFDWDFYEDADPTSIVFQEGALGKEMITEADWISAKGLDDTREVTMETEQNQYTLENLNMCYVQADCNEETDTGAILECSHNWTISKLQEWLVGYNHDMLESVKQWLANEAEIAEGGYLEVWINI